MAMKSVVSGKVPSEIKDELYRYCAEEERSPSWRIGKLVTAFVEHRRKESGKHEGEHEQVDKAGA